MNPSQAEELTPQLTQHDMLLLRTLLGRFGGQPLNQATPDPTPAPLIQPPSTINSIIQPSQPRPGPVESPSQSYPRNSVFPSHSGHTSVAPAIMPYHSALPGAQGHPPRSTGISSTIENIGSSITSQVNHQRLSAAAANLPPHVTLPQRTVRRRRRGPAILPPTLTPSFSINSVLSNVNPGSSPLIRIKIKVYPPQASH
jgi:hypothetical protein